MTEAITSNFKIWIYYGDQKNMTGEMHRKIFANYNSNMTKFGIFFSEAIKKCFKDKNKKYINT